MSEGDDGFLARWSKRKAALREGREAPPEPAAPAPAALRPERVEAPVAPVAPATGADPAEPKAPAPTLDDIAGLTRQSDFRRFVAPDVDPGVRNAALKKLFADPQFNVMDGLDTYIDDYGKPDPIPASMLRKMVQSAALGLFDDEKPESQASSPTAPTTPTDDHDPAVRLQPDDAAGSDRPAGGAGEDAGLER